eukprot:m.216835 g.216835  ORF g.216835 m.216835 type:complete len:93 (+) comp18661_c2_seq2:1682-1960(+)
MRATLHKTTLSPSAAETVYVVAPSFAAAGAANVAACCTALTSLPDVQLMVLVLWLATSVTAVTCQLLQIRVSSSSFPFTRGQAEGFHTYDRT